MSASCRSRRAWIRAASFPSSNAACSEFGFVGCNLNPDPSGGKFSEPPLTDKWWYPVYEKLCELDVPAMVHVSQACNPAFHTTGSYYLSADTVAFMQLMMSDLFKDFPRLRFIIPHGGGAVPFHWGRFRGIAQDQKRPPLPELMRDNVFFDTCVYHQPGIDLLLKVVPMDNILFASEMVGAVRGIDPETGHYYDDTKRYIDGSSLSAADKRKIFEGNIRRVFPRLKCLMQPRKLGPYEVTRHRFRLHEPVACLWAAATTRGGRARDQPRARSRRHAFRYRGAVRLRRERTAGWRIAGRRPDNVVVASKCGLFGRDGKRVMDGRPESIRAICEQSLRNLKTDRIDLYYLHRWDQRVPIEDSVGAMAELVRAGKIRAIGLSEIGAATLRKAQAVHPIAALQSEYSLWTRNPEIAVLEECRRLGITLVAFSPLGRGFLTGGMRSPTELVDSDIRRTMPRFQSPNFEANLRLLSPWTRSPRRRAVRERSWRWPGCWRSTPIRW